ncbi:hypothetical protein [Micromonospora sp. NPDC051296]|uniref:hypothetical protein n=1 Tax=Micromonospora sp. NPDC051296 TaxID=3155046 RepID=UPI00341CE1A8
MLLAGLLATYTTIAAASAIGSTGQLSGHGQVGWLAGLDNLFLPLIVLTAGYLLAVDVDVDRHRLVRVAAATLVAALVANAAVAYLSLMASPGAYDDLLSLWWTGDTGVSTAERAATMGRHSGIFNQPAEAGIMYSVGLVAAVCVLRRRPVLLAAAGVAIAVGGLLTASKIFLLVGLPLAAWQTWVGSSWRTRAGSVLAVAAVFALYGHQARQPDTQIGGSLLDAWLNPGDRQGSILSYYSASRFGENSTLADAADVVLAHAPWFGFGLGGVRIPYDSSWVEALVMAGIVGVALQAAIFAALVWCWLDARRRIDPAVARFGAGLLVIVTAGSLGLPTLTSNRVTTVVWLLVALLLVSPPAPRWRAVPPPDRAAPDRLLAAAR